MFKRIKIAKFKKEIEEICTQKGYEILGEIKKCSIGNNNWTFAVKTPHKTFLVKLIVPFGLYNSGLCLDSQTHISATATLFAFRGIFGTVNVPITSKYSYKLPQTAFGLEADACEKVFLVYPKCTHFALRPVDAPGRLVPFRVGIKCGDIHIHDGSSFKYAINNPTEKRKFAKYGE